MKTVKHSLQFIFATTLILLGFVSVALSQEPTPTIPPPRIVSATPLNFVPTPTVSSAPVDSTATIPPPPIVSATPDPSSALGSSGMSLADELLLQRAVDTSYANGFAFTLTAQLVVETEDGTGILQITGDGFIDNLEDPNQLLMQLLMNVKIDLDGETAEFLIEERIVDGNFYARGESLDNSRQTRWFGYPFSTFIDSLVEDFDFISLPGFGEATTEDERIDALGALLNLESYITTRRMDGSTAEEARFVTEIDIEQLMDSPETVDIVLRLLAASGGIQVGSGGVEALSEAFSTFRRLIIPDADWTFERYVDVESETITRAEFDFDLELNIPTGEGIVDTTPVEITFDAVFVLSGYDETFTVEAPADALVVENMAELANLDLLMPEG